MNNFFIKHEETDLELNLTIEQILTTKEALGVSGDDLADILTTLNPDTYADKLEEILSEVESVEEAIEYDEEGYYTCRSYHRILNWNFNNEECEELWLQSCEDTLNG